MISAPDGSLLTDPPALRGEPPDGECDVIVYLPLALADSLTLTILDQDAQDTARLQAREDLLRGASAAPYECTILLTPPSDSDGPDSVASAAPAPLVGFATDNLGRSHAAIGSTIRYAFCPPTSGAHWNVAGRAPLRRDFHGPNDSVSPGTWVHNLEHGYVVIAYAGEPEADVMDSIREVYDEADQKRIAAQCGLPNKVIAVRFDDMAEPYAALAWDRALLMSEWDPELALKFANQWQDPRQGPEPAC